MSALMIEQRVPLAVPRDVWAVELLRRSGSQADVRRTDDRVHVWLGDDTHADHAHRLEHRLRHGTDLEQVPAGAGSCSDAVLHADGRVVVTCCTAPPALVVSRGRSHLLPAVPGTTGVERLSDGDVLVMCSASALDHLPAGIGAILAWAPRELAARHPDALLDRLMLDTDVGSALLARYHAPTNGHCDEEENR